MNLEDAVLLAIAEGLNNPKDIAKKLNVRIEDIKVAINSLEAGGFIVRKVKGFIFKREVYELTKIGFDRVVKIKEELKNVAEEFRKAYELGDRMKIERLYHDYGYFIPFMVAFGLLDLVWLSMLTDIDVFGDVDEFVDDFDDSGFEDFDTDFDVEF